MDARQGRDRRVVYSGVMSSEPSPTASCEMRSSDRRTRGRARRRDQVYGAAVALFVEKGFDSTTMEDIADRADVARATVFNHFARKSAFLDEWSARRRLRALSAVYTEHLQGRPVREILARYMVELAKVSTQTRIETVALMGAAVHTTNLLGNPALAQELTAILRRKRAEGELRQGADPEIAGLLLATGYFATVTAWIDAEPQPFELGQRLLQIVDIVLDGIAGQGSDGPT